MCSSFIVLHVLLGYSVLVEIQTPCRHSSRVKVDGRKERTVAVGSGPTTPNKPPHIYLVARWNGWLAWCMYSIATRNSHGETVLTHPLVSLPPSWLVGDCGCCECASTNEFLHYVYSRMLVVFAHCCCPCSFSCCCVAFRSVSSSTRCPRLRAFELAPWNLSGRTGASPTSGVNQGLRRRGAHRRR